ncbi:MAG TPA: acyltransferase family protein [Solirubrobacteraceae bacterium]|nr:acyltransferase family protein [Solirubrobacteraceae bacterium]
MSITTGARVPDLRFEPVRVEPHQTEADLTRHRGDIQGLRAVAVLLVALGHAGVSFLQGGYVGVDVFFVLSGFLITGLLISEARTRRHVSLIDFYLRRARRILPAATLTLVATDLAVYHLLNFVRAKQYLQDSISSAIFGANIHFASIGTNYFAQGQPPSPFQHFWSLSVEEQFYVVWPTLFILVLGLSFRRYAMRPAWIRERAINRVLVVVALIAGVSLVFSILYTSQNPAAAYFSTPARVWELGLGACLALGATRLAAIPVRWRMFMSWAGIGLIAVAAVAFSASTEFPGYSALLPTVGAALLIAAGVASVSSRGSAGRLLDTAPMRYVGDRSYSFYLWHWPFLIVYAQHVGHSVSVTKNLGLLVAAFAVSIITFRLVEKPLRSAALTKKPAMLPVMAVVSVLAVLVVATSTISTISDHENQLNSAAQFTAAPVLAVATTPATTTATSGATSSTTTGSPSTGGGLIVGGQPIPAVIAEVQADARHRAMPSVLLPPTASLLNDLPRGYPGHCLVATGATSEPICRLGAASAHRTIVVLGDSHAEQWLPDVLSFAKTDGWVVVPLIKQGCTASRWMTGFEAPSCPVWFKWALHVISTLRPTVVFVGSEYMTLSSQLDPSAAGGLDRVAKDLRGHAGHVVIMGDVISHKGQPVDCLLGAHATPEGCSEPLRNGESDQTAFVAQQASYDKVSFIDPTGWFCDKGTCPLVVGNVITFRDENHVSATYATALRDVFRSAFYAAIGSKP